MFQAVGDKFFHPFCGKNRELYFACISELIDKSKEVPVLYETDARDCLILYLQNSKYAIETEQIGERGDIRAHNGTPQENASAILRYFRDCGWVSQREVGRSGDHIAAIGAYCRKLVDALHKIFDSDENSAITNHIFSMYEILSSAFAKDSGRAIRPYGSILVPLVEEECDLKNELLILKDSIREIMRAVLKMADVNSFGHFLMKDELLNRFFQDYFFIKRSGLIPAYIANIDRMLRRLRRSDLYGKMVREYGEQKRVGEDLARETVERLFAELDSFINLEYGRDIGYIDKKINTYYNLYSIRMAMVLGSGTNLEQQLNQLLLCLKESDAREQERILQDVSSAFRVMEFGYVGRKSIERRKRRGETVPSAGLLDAPLSDAERERLTEELLKERPSHYSIEKVRAYLDGLAIPDEGMSVGEFGIHTRKDAMMAAAAILYSKSPGFPYEVEFGEEMVETDVAQIRAFRVKKTGGKRAFYE